jgi:pimeloyl-ACP methyl ester carboxylesterase
MRLDLIDEFRLDLHPYVAGGWRSRRNNEGGSMPDRDQAPAEAPARADSMDRRTLIESFTAGAAMTLISGSVQAHAAAPPEPVRPARGGARNVVLVHGAYADGSSWGEVIRRLQAAGLKPTAVQNPLTSLADDAAATRRVLDMQHGPTILVAHSFGGTVITEVGDHPHVVGLVYVAARAPDAGEDYAALAKRFPSPPANAGLVYNDGFGRLTERAFLHDFANGVERAKARVLFAVQGRVSATLFTDRTTVAAWRAKPCWYAVSKRDRTTSPKLERFLAKRMQAKTTELDSGHLSLVTHPRKITALILDAARSSR